MKKRLAAAAIAASAVAPAPADAAFQAPVETIAKKTAKVTKKDREKHRLASAVVNRVRMMRRVTAPYRGWLASTRACESGGDYSTNTGNGFYGAYQFTLSSWASVGGKGMPNLAAPLEQDYRAVRLLKVQGAGAWPNCG